MSERTYTIFRNHYSGGKSTDTVVETGLSWDEALVKRDELAEHERTVEPLKSSWSRDVFVIRMERAA